MAAVVPLQEASPGKYSNNRRTELVRDQRSRKQAKLHARLTRRVTLKNAVSVLTRVTLKTAVTVFKLCSFIKSVPFELVSTQSLDVRKFESGRKLALWHLANWLVFISVTFQSVTYIHTVRFETDVNALSVHTMYFVENLFSFVFMFSLYRKPDVCILMLKQHRVLLDIIADVGVTIPPWSSHPLVIWGVNYMAFAVGSSWFAATTFFLVRPRFPCYIFSYIPSEYQNLWVMGMCYFYELTWFAMGLSVVVAFFCYWCADIFTFTSCLSALLDKRHWNPNDIKLYKCLQLFCITFNDFNGSFFTTGFTFALVTLPIIFIYMALTLTGVHILVFLVFPILAVFNVTLIISFLPQHSKVGLFSTQLVQAMKRGKRTTKGVQVFGRGGVGITREEMMVLHKEMEAFAPIGIRIWFFGVYTLHTSEVLMDQMFNNILLLMSL